MTNLGPRPAGRPWTGPEDKQLLELEASGMSRPLIAIKLKRSVSAIHTRISGLRRRAKSLAEGAPEAKEK